MDVSIECSNQSTHIVLKVAGQWTESSSQIVIDTAHREATKLGKVRILLDLSEFSLPDKEITRYWGGTYLAKVLRPPFRVAAIGGRPEMVNFFAENAAVNRGALFHAFVDETSAIRWLLEK